jgi:DeoR family suf operon transcriptional repressor
MIEPALASFPPTRRAVVELLKVKGEASAAELAGGLELTVEAVRQQLAELEEAGFVAHRRRADGPGRPTHCYSLTPAAGALFPQRYGDLTNELLDYVSAATPELVPTLFEKRRQRRAEAAELRLAGKSFEERVVELARILEDDGYLAVAERVDDDLWRIVERNCAILDVALKYGNACSSEIEFLRDVMPDADIERVTHIVAGAKACGYEVRRRKSSRRPARARASQRSA